MTTLTMKLPRAGYWAQCSCGERFIGHGDAGVRKAEEAYEVHAAQCPDANADDAETPTDGDK